ncbi:hypothetical protein ACQ4PT_049921 [Festuca glaucescens]
MIGATGIREASEVQESGLVLEGVDSNLSGGEPLQQAPAAPRKKKVGFITFATGVVHGLQPDAPLMVLLALALPSRFAGAAYLVEFISVIDYLITWFVLSESDQEFGYLFAFIVIMECNKDEALRAKALAERKMLEKDFVAARKMIDKAQQLSTEVDDISQMLTVCDIHCAAGTKVNGEIDWYGILQVPVFTNDDTLINKQYCNLTLLLHPDKNKFAGAEAAFKLVAEANMMLTDNSKRSVYDMKRRGSVRVAAARPSPYQQEREAAPARPVNLQQPANPAGPATFWTICSNCGMRYQYYTTLLKKAIRCQSCMKPFIAHDLNNQPVPPVAKQQSAQLNRSAGAPQNFPSPQINVRGQQAWNYATQGVQANYGSHNATVNTKTGEDGNRASAAGGPKENTKFARTLKGSSTSGLKRGRETVVECSGSKSTTDTEEEDIYVDGAAVKPSEYSCRSSRQKQELKYKEESGDEDVDDDGNYNDVNTVNDSNFKRTRKGGMLHSDDKSNETKLNEERTEQSGLANSLNHEKIYNSVSSNGLDPNFDASGNDKLNCVDPEFCNFDQLRDESQFRANQVWAIYDAQGCIPRFYAQITKVKMTPKFVLHFVWLDFDPTNKAEAWSYADLPVACGHFKYGDPGTTEETNMFSHTMYCVKSKTRNTFEMYPRKGEVWALFKGWDIGWSSDADNHTDFEYEVVQVVSDFMTGTSIIVMPLVKIKGFISLFMQSKEPTPYVIPQDSTLRFSHLVPYHIMCGTEKEGIPEGALELDPAAFPLNLEEAYASVVHPNLDASDEDKFSCVDPEFFNFDQLRDVSQFRANQIWAVYDSQGCMPRFYARIKTVKMAPNFVVHFVWLEFEPTNKAEEAWSNGVLPVACGHFKYGDSGTAKETNMFSHTIYCVKSKTASTFEIYPRKGEVWALFKGWDVGWSSDADNHTDFEYEVVQVVSDLTAGTGIIAMPLVKIKGFVSLFMQSKEATLYEIPQDNTLRFSHLVPHHTMCGTEREGIPEEALELDPAALPVNLEEAFASVIPEISSVKGQEFDTKCAGSSTGNNSRKGSMRAGKVAKEKTIEHSIPPAVQGTDDEEANDLVQGEFQCPDSEFYEFSEIRLLHKFKPGQVWAIYSDVDKFPNFYALIKNVDPKNNIVEARWLDVCPLGEEEKQLVKEDRTVGCGTFKVAVGLDGNITYTDTESFSHPVLARPTGRRNEYEIIPAHGEIWAIYKNWTAGWTAQDFKNCEYELVEILAHTDESIQVQLLRKVDGYTAVFRRDDAVKTISKDEYPKFSHQVPCFHLTNEKGGKLRGYLELDPYSLPDVFL